MSALLLAAQDTIGILQKHDLMTPQKIQFSRFLVVSESDPDQSTVIDTEVSVVIPEDLRIDQIAKYAADYLASNFGSPFHFPISLYCFGKGVVYNSLGQPETAENVVWLWVMHQAGLNVDVLTQSDVWLPYTLTGEAQSAVWENNKGRLSQALEEISIILESEPIIDDGNEYAVIEGYSLDNVRVRGEVINVLE